jgi:hypothetical protein
MLYRIPINEISIEVDTEQETVLIEGVLYNFDFFKYMKEPDPQRPVYITKGDDGMRFIFADKRA